jgi:hypothetical protein
MGRLFFFDLSWSSFAFLRGWMVFVMLSGRLHLSDLSNFSSLVFVFLLIWIFPPKAFWIWFFL